MFVDPVPGHVAAARHKSSLAFNRDNESRIRNQTLDELFRELGIVFNPQVLHNLKTTPSGVKEFDISAKWTWGHDRVMRKRERSARGTKKSRTEDGSKLRIILNPGRGAYTAMRAMGSPQLE